MNLKIALSAFLVLAAGALRAVGPLSATTEDYLRRKWRSDVTDPTTGLGLEALKAEAQAFADARTGKENWCLVKAHLFEMICRKMAIGVSPEDEFPAFAVWSRRNRVLSPILRARTGEIDRTACAAAVQLAKTQLEGHVVRHDYDHAAPDWDAALRLGFTGLRRRLDEPGVRNEFTEAMRIAADAMLECVGRLERYAQTCPDKDAPRVRELAAGLRALRAGPPQTTYEAMLFQLLYFVFGEHVDHLQVRTLGNLDRLLRPYYEADLSAGRITRERLKDHLRHFFWQWGSIDNWWGQPFYLGGTREDGSTGYCDVSRAILEVIDELNLPTPKLQLKMSAKTPSDIWAKALDMSRRHRSLVYCGEAPMARCMKAMGFSDEEVRTCDLWGCYECQPRGKANTTLPGVLNFVQIVQNLLARAARNEFSAATFDDFKAAYLDEVRQTAGLILEAVCGYERPMDEIIPALVHSLSIGRCVSTGRNAIGNGMDYNLSVILQVGAGTAVDSLLGVREIVYEKGEMPLEELGRTMAADWQGHEALCARMRASRRKWGNGDPAARALMGEILHVFGAAVNGRPNSRGGKFFASGHSIDYFQLIGRHSGATPDGRRAKDEFSKNISPAPGADREGATALIGDIRAIDARDIPGDVILDVMLHPSSVDGEKGLATMRVLVEEYFAAGGCSVHFNVFSVEELRDAQLHPERYENLQVRVCGWNVRWNDLGRKLQDAYILRCQEVR